MDSEGEKEGGREREGESEWERVKERGRVRERESTSSLLVKSTDYDSTCS